VVHLGGRIMAVKIALRIKPNTKIRRKSKKEIQKEMAEVNTGLPEWRLKKEKNEKEKELVVENQKNLIECFQKLVQYLEIQEKKEKEYRINLQSELKNISL